MVIEKGEPVYVPDAISHPRYKYFPETGEERFHTLPRRAGAGRAAKSRSACWSRRRSRGANSPSTEIRLLQHRRQPGRADSVAFPAARIARHQGKRARRIPPPDDRGQSPAQGLRKSRRQDANAAAAKDSPPAPGRTARRAGIRAGPRACGRHFSEHHRSQSTLARHQGRDASASRKRSTRSRAELRSAQGPDGAADARVGPQDFRRPSHDSRRRGIRRPHPRHRRERLHRRERAVPRDRGALRLRCWRSPTATCASARPTSATSAIACCAICARKKAAAPFAKPTIIVAEELTLSQLTLVSHENLAGIALQSGGVTSHAAILARSFEIPTVVGVEHLMESVVEGDHLVLDGNSGVVYVNPPARRRKRLPGDDPAATRRSSTS